jgi:hypothetical protein
MSTTELVPSQHSTRAERRPAHSVVALVAGSRPQPAQRTPVLDLVVPVYNEERDLAHCVQRLRAHLDSSFPYPAVVTIADNASTDGTWRIAGVLAREIPGVRAIHLDAKGRGRALRAAWSVSEADVVAYTDVDLSTDLNALLPLVAPLLSGHSDLSIGTRLAAGARVRRGPKREMISRSYNAMLRLVLRNGFSDAQCGFKAVRTGAARALLPAVRDEGWFFDTELLVLAERNGLRIHEVPVDWTDDPDSRVRIVRTALEDLRGVARLLAERASGRDRVRGLEARLVPAGAWRGREVAGALTLALCALAVAALSPLVGLPAAVVAVALAGVLRAALASARPVRPAERSGPERRPRRPRRPRPPRRPRGR